MNISSVFVGGFVLNTSFILFFFTGNPESYTPIYCFEKYFWERLKPGLFDRC